MAGSLDRRTPRAVRERQALRAVQVGAVGGTAFAVTTLLWIVGVMGGGLPLVLLVITALAVLRFRSVTGSR